MDLLTFQAFYHATKIEIKATLTIIMFSKQLHICDHEEVSIDFFECRSIISAVYFFNNQFWPLQFLLSSLLINNFKSHDFLLDFFVKYMV